MFGGYSINCQGEILSQGTNEQVASSIDCFMHLAQSLRSSSLPTHQKEQGGPFPAFFDMNNILPQYFV